MYTTPLANLLLLCDPIMSLQYFLQIVALLVRTIRHVLRLRRLVPHQFNLQFVYQFFVTAYALVSRHPVAEIAAMITAEGKIVLQSTVIRRGLRHSVIPRALHRRRSFRLCGTLRIHEHGIVSSQDIVIQVA